MADDGGLFVTDSLGETHVDVDDMDSPPNSPPNSTHAGASITTGCIPSTTSKESVMKLTTTSSLEHRVRTTQFAVTSTFGGASVNVDLLAPGGSTSAAPAVRARARPAPSPLRCADQTNHSIE